VQLTVQLAIKDERLRAALGSSLARHEEIAVAQRDDGVGPRAVVVVAGESSPAACATLVATGAPVIVLTAIPRDAEERHYRAAGEYAYLPMMLDTAALLDAIRSSQGMAAGSLDEDAGPF
jgi:hypothetical protein